MQHQCIFWGAPRHQIHTGAVLMLGHGSMPSMLCKRKIDTKSSTEVEWVGIDDVLTFVMWMKHFFKSQLEQINQDLKLKNLGKEIIIEHNNTSAIQLKRNRWKSSNKCTKYINVRYFYITDKLKNGDVTWVLYKSTEIMTSNYLRKALEGILFIKHCNTLMGLNGVDQWQFYWKYEERLNKLCVSGWGTTQPY